MRRLVLYGKSGANASTDFIIKVKTDNAGTSASNQFTYTGGVGSYDVLAINQSTFVEQTFTGLSGAATLTFSEGAGVYILKLTPTGGTPFSRLAFANSGDKSKVLEHMNYGTVTWSDMGRMYEGCNNIVFSSTDTPDLSNISVVLGSFSGLARTWSNAISLISVSYKGFNFSRVRSFASKHDGATALTSVDYTDVIWNEADTAQCNNWFSLTPANVIGLGNCTIKPTTLSFAFNRLLNNNIDLSGMNTVSLTNISIMCQGNTNVQTLNCTGWDWSSITTILSFMSGATSFQSITGLTSGQDLKECTDMASAFRTTVYNQLFAVQLRLAGVNLFRIFQSSGMSTANYTDTIVYWANYAFDNAGTPINVNMAEQTGRTFDTSRSGGANFANAGEARTYLTGTCSWTISGDTVI